MEVNCVWEAERSDRVVVGADCISLLSKETWNISLYRHAKKDTITKNSMQFVFVEKSQPVNTILKGKIIF